MIENFLEKEFLLDDYKVVQEYETVSFLSNVKAMLGKSSAFADLQFKSNHYVDYITKAIDSVSEISLDVHTTRSILAEYVRTANPKGTNSISIDRITYDRSEINSAPLKEFVSVVNSKLNDATKMNNVALPSLKDKINLKKAISPGNILLDGGHFTDEEFRSKSTTYLSPIYIKGKVIPFVDSFENEKKSLLATANNVLKDIRDVQSAINAAINNVNNMKLTDDKHKFASFRYNAYLLIKDLMDMTAYTSCIIIRKLSTFRSSAFGVIYNCNRISNTREIWDPAMIALNKAKYSHPITIEPVDGLFIPINNRFESVEDGSDSYPETPSGVSNDGTADLAQQLMKGKADTFVQTADEYVNKYMSIPKDKTYSIFTRYAHHIGDKDETPTDLSYDRSPYEEIIKIFIEIGQGLDNIVSKCDGLYMPEELDLIVNDSGFLIPLDKRFKERLSKMDDVSRISRELDIHPDGVIDGELYKLSVNELKDFSKNASDIAAACNSVTVRIDNIKQTIEHKLPSEIGKLHEVTEIEEYIDNFMIEFGRLNTMIADSMMGRLKSLAGFIFGALDRDSKQEIPLTEYYNFMDLAYESEKELLDISNEYITNLYEEAYFKEREKLLTGRILVTEADTSVNKNAVNGKIQVGKAQVLSNGSKISGLIDKIVVRIKEFFTKFTDKADTVKNRILGSKTYKDVLDNREALLQKDYSNDSIQIADYAAIPIDNIIQILDKVNTNIGALSPQDVQSYQNNGKAEILQKICPDIKLKSTDDNELNANIYSFFLVGQGDPSQTKELAGNELGNWVKSNAVPYVVSYADKVDSVKDIVKKITDTSNALAEKIKTTPTKQDKSNTNVTPGQPVVNTELQTASYHDSTIGLLFSEAEVSGTPSTDANGNNKDDANKNTETVMSTNTTKIVSISQAIVSSAMNAITKRLDDYCVVLYPFIPPKENTK